MNRKVLIVDDEPNMLSSYRRQLSGHYDVVTAANADDGLKALSEQGPFAAVVSDYRMPEKDGVRFLSEARTNAPETVRIMLTGYADVQAAIDAVNRGNVYRFLTKPCSVQELLRTLDGAMEKHDVEIAEHKALAEKLSHNVKALDDILPLVNPLASGQTTRLRRLVGEIVRELRLDIAHEADLAAKLHQIGLVAVPGEVLDKVQSGKPLSDREKRMFREHPLEGRKILAQIPELCAVAEGVGYQQKDFSGGGVPEDGNKGEEIPVIGRILKVALDFDGLTASGYSHEQAIITMIKNLRKYDPEILHALHGLYLRGLTGPKSPCGVKGELLRTLLPNL